MTSFNEENGIFTQRTDDPETAPARGLGVCCCCWYCARLRANGEDGPDREELLVGLPKDELRSRGWPGGGAPVNIHAHNQPNEC